MREKLGKVFYIMFLVATVAAIMLTVLGACFNVMGLLHIAAWVSGVVTLTLVVCSVVFPAVTDRLTIHNYEALAICVNIVVWFTAGFIMVYFTKGV